MTPRSWTLRTGIVLASAAILIGCGGERERTAADRPADQSGQGQPITISGCLGTGIGNDLLMLTGVQVAAPAEQRDTSTAAAQSPITPDTQVRLRMDDRERLVQLVGQRVTVTGVLTHDGRNTIGTSGAGQTPASGQAESRQDKSAAASEQHHSKKVADEAGPIAQRSMNNGTFPEVTVSQISGSGEKCVSWLGPERR